MTVFDKTFREVNGVSIPGTWLQAFIHNGEVIQTLKGKDSAS